MGEWIVFCLMLLGVISLCCAGVYRFAYTNGYKAGFALGSLTTEVRTSRTNFGLLLDTKKKTKVREEVPKPN